MESVRDKVISPEHPVYRRISQVVQKIVNSNQDLEFMRQQSWTIVVVNSEESNAFVLPVSPFAILYGCILTLEPTSRWDSGVYGNIVNISLIE